jgi:hypothetical protein
MIDQSFDSITRAFNADNSRRTVMKRLAGGALAALVVRFGPEGAAEARKKKNRKNTKKTPKLKLNAFRCVDVGKACRGNNANCCSGICKGKKPKKGKKDTSRCVAHNVLECLAGQDTCALGFIACGTDVDSACHQTTGNAAFCAGKGACAECRKDTDCEGEFGPGAACVVCAECEETGTACAAAGI